MFVCCRALALTLTLTHALYPLFHTQVVALEGRYASRKTREFVTGDVRGRLKLSSQVCVY